MWTKIFKINNIKKVINYQLYGLRLFIFNIFVKLINFTNSKFSKINILLAFIAIFNFNVFYWSTHLIFYLKHYF
ncbi:MAG: hypothetical protein CMI74_03025 [Candidatus Pelagibacter sp.]|nr:hypothetical protein [Candidatus Pelagibacter sp.]OUW11699.1 MAG: hypothetical protein CBD26_01255 [Candidatus Pelagibacter sp. TMED166]